MNLLRKRIWKQNSLIDRHRRIGGHIDSVDGGGNTLLMSLIKLGASQAFDLISAGADVNKSNDNGETALMLAVSSCYSANEVADLVSSLINAGGADTINNIQHQGRTALEIAYCHQKAVACYLLLRSGASVSTPCSDGVTLFEHVRENLAFYKKQRIKDRNAIKFNEFIFSVIEAKLIVETVLSTEPLQNVIVHDSTTKTKKSRRI